MAAEAATPRYRLRKCCKSSEEARSDRISADQRRLAQHAIGLRIARHRAVQRVALDGYAACFADEALDVRLVQFLMRRAAGAFPLGDVVPDDGAVQVVAAPVE